MAACAGLISPALPFPSGNYETVFRDEKELHDHKIAEIKFFTVSIRYPRNVGRNAIRDNHGTGNTSSACFLRTDQGAEGWGLMEGKKENYTRLSENMTGKQISDLFTVNGGMVATENRGFEIAFFDLAGNILKKPVYQLLGSPKPIPNKIYSGMIYLDDLDPSENPGGIDKLLKECAYDYSLGYRQFKLKIGRGKRWMERSSGDQRDAEVTREISAAFPDCEILVDANDGYSPAGFVNYLKSIEPTRLFWVEEPFRETPEDCRMLRDFMKSGDFNRVLYADGEASPDFTLMQKLIDNKLIDVILYDILDYGFARWRKLMPELGKINMLASPHAWGCGIKTRYIVHQSAAYGNTATIEGVTSFSDDVELSGYKIEKGTILPPDDPGFGMKLLKKI